MRDKNRIKPFLGKIQEFWEIYPDLRFGQIISILSDKMDRDIFYVEENELLEKFEELIKENKQL